MKQISVPSFNTPETGYKVYQQFRGLDLSTDETQIDDSRSPWMVNMISDSGGYPEVRVGWRALHTFSGQINGIFLFKLNGIQQMIVHAGTRLVRLMKDDAGNYTETTLLSGITDALS